MSIRIIVCSSFFSTSSFSFSSNDGFDDAFDNVESFDESFDAADESDGGPVTVNELPLFKCGYTAETNFPPALAWSHSE